MHWGLKGFLERTTAWVALVSFVTGAVAPSLALAGNEFSAGHEAIGQAEDKIMRAALEAANQACPKGMDREVRLDCYMKRAYAGYSPEAAAMAKFKATIKDAKDNPTSNYYGLYDWVKGKGGADFDNAVMNWAAANGKKMSDLSEYKNWVEKNSEMTMNRVMFRVVGAQKSPHECIMPHFNSGDVGYQDEEYRCERICRPASVFNKDKTLVDTRLCKTKSEWEAYDKKKKKRKGIRKGGGHGYDLLTSCRYGYQAGLEAGEFAPPDSKAACHAIAGSELRAFSREILITMEHRHLDDYFELLRIEAASRLLQAQAELTGTLPAEPPKECKVYKEGFDDYAKLPETKKLLGQRAKSIESVDFRNQLRAAAIRTNSMIVRISAIKAQLDACKVEKSNCVDQHKCKGSCDKKALKAEKADLRTMIAQNAAAFPYLNVDHPRDAEPYESLPMVKKMAETNDDGMKKLVEEGRKKIGKEIMDAMSKYCDPGSISWMELVQNPALTGPVLAKFPFFSFVQQCAGKEVEDFEENGKIFGGLFMGSCVLGSLVGAGLLCAGLFTINAAAKYNKAHDALYECPQSNDAVCSEKERAKRRAELDAAIEELELSAVFLVIEGGVAVARVAGAGGAVSKAAGDADDVADVAGGAARGGANVPAVAVESRFASELSQLGDVQRAKAIKVLQAAEKNGVSEAGMNRFLDSLKGCVK